MRLLSLFLLQIIVIGAAHAQVIKCVDPKTKTVSFTDGACAATDREILIEPRHSAQYYENENIKAQEARERIDQSLQREAQETRLLARDTQQQASPREPAPIDNSNSYECSIAKQALGVAQTNNKPNLDTIALKRQEAEVACLGANAHVQLEEAREKRKAEELKIAAERTTSVVYMTSCDQSGCWGSDGNRYNAQGGTLAGPHDRTCQKLGNTVQCQ